MRNAPRTGKGRVKREDVRRIAEPVVQRAVGRARDVARSTAERLPRHDAPLTLTPADLSTVPPSALLLEASQARAARRVARSLGLPRALDASSAWAALGALSALVRIADDGRHRAVVVDPSGPRSVFSRWAHQAGFAPVALPVTDPQIAGESIEVGSVDMVVLLHPRVVEPADLDLELAGAAAVVRPGGLICLTVQVGPSEVGGLDVAGINGLLARAAEQGLTQVGHWDVEHSARARAALQAHPDRPAGLALVTLRRR
ncbi:hypothetical protein ACMYYO_11410 [Dermacoccaceae bacterium W4C1]